MLKAQFQFLEKDRIQDYNLITDLSLIDTKAEFEQYAQQIQAISFKNDYHKLVIRKLISERDLMAKYAHLKYFTGGISVC